MHFLRILALHQQRLNDNVLHEFLSFCFGGDSSLGMCGIEGIVIKEV